MSVNLSELFPPSGGSSGGDVDCNIDVSENPPAPPYEIGQQFFSTSTGREYVWVGSGWAATSVTGGATGDGGSGGDGAGSDSFWANVSLLINGDGEADGSQNIVDATNKNQITVVNGTKVSTSEFKHGSGAVHFDNTGHLELSDDSALTMGTGDFTVEYWAKTESADNSKYKMVVDNSWDRDTDAWQIYHRYQQITVTCGNGSGAITSVVTTSQPAVHGQWIHVAVVRISGELSIYVDGTLAASDQMAMSFGRTATNYVGSQAGSTTRFVGYLDDLRITKGIARYTTNFTPPDKLPTQQGARVITVDIPEEPMQAEDNDADLS